MGWPNASPGEFEQYFLVAEPNGSFYEYPTFDKLVINSGDIVALSLHISQDGTIVEMEVHDWATGSLSHVTNHEIPGVILSGFVGRTPKSVPAAFTGLDTTWQTLRPYYANDLTPTVTFSTNGTLAESSNYMSIFASGTRGLNRGRFFQVGLLLLMITGVGILGFGIVVLVAPQVVPGYSGPTEFALLRTVGVATIGMGFFGLALTLLALRRGERWGWFALWFYPLFWVSHLAGLGVRPGVDDVFFIVISIVGLLLTAR